ncbi:hypothetical protein SAMN05216489_03952 [Streptomyces sp. 3213]|uniref:hypothetical protein n=1 Tax=Streptomyces sp. 3213.3 TaxID=1855348 RepID=UPI000896CF0E|nr:hypothetical protein [Streptomyces sp. 3213.3]SED62451.1 hypothetical protein SAMN05216489_03952 [Streptomyces sp. 3213] [Streptomyces sp. 3213.3]
MFFIVLVLLALIVGGAVAYGKRQAGGGSSPYGAGSAQQVYDADAGAEATRWVERLGGSLSTLDAGGNSAARQALADAAERHRAAEGQLATAYSPMQYGLVTQTAIEGLHHIRTARAALGLDPGPALPEQGAGGGQVTVGGQTYTAAAQPGANTPYYYPGGVVNGRSMPGGWYSTPWWKTALVAGAAGVGGMLLADALFDGFHHHGPGGGMFGGGPGGFGGFGGPGLF